ncbi:Zn-ribbon domain-containing OB-fold protein [Rhodococcus koreensis]
MTTPSRSAVPDWFDASETRLLGKACTRCHSVFFPPTIDRCRNPRCGGDVLETHPLSTRGRIWSWTRNHYKPPAPYVSGDPFEPYTVLAVELEEDGLVVLGQLSPDSPPANVGDTVSLRTEKLLEDEDGVQLMWRWTLDNSETVEVAS